MKDDVSAFMADVKAKNPAEPEFHQAVQRLRRGPLILELPLSFKLTSTKYSVEIPRIAKTIVGRA